MVNSNRYNWRCLLCQKPGSTLHEIFFGRGIREQYGIRHHLQAPLCKYHHDCAHGNDATCHSGNMDWFQNDLCERLGIDRDATKALIFARDHATLEKGDEARLKRLMEYCE
jgi:hypothetical protein